MDLTAGLATVLSAPAALLDLVLPGTCALCGRAGAPLCPGCARAARACRHDGGARAVAPDPSPPGMPPCWAAARMEGAVRLAVTAYKDTARRDLASVLAPLLADAVSTALRAHPATRRLLRHRGDILVVPVPGSRAGRRRRGDLPLARLVDEALPLVPGRVLAGPAVRLGRRTADQAGLGALARRANLAGAMAARRGWQAVVAGRVCLVVDDVVTTGSSIAETARVLREMGAGIVLSATVAATERRALAAPVRPD